MRYLILLSIAFLLSCGNKIQYPIVKEGQVIINNKTKIAIPGTSTRSIEGYGKVEHIEEAKILRDWERIIVAKRDVLSEIQGVSFDIYDFKGLLLNSSKEYWGEFEVIYSEIAGFIMLFKHYGYSDDSYIVLLDRFGNEFNRINVENLSFKSGFTEDGKLVWVISHASSDDVVDIEGSSTGQYKSRLSVYSIKGEELMKKVFNSASNYTMQYNNVSYVFGIPEPGPVN